MSLSFALSTRTRCVVAGAALAGLSGLALAHTGADGAAHHGSLLTSAWAGLSHPFTGLDHLAAMTTLGLWSGLTSRRWWQAPAAFASLLLAGALLSLGGLAMPMVEPMIAASVLVLGLLLASRSPLPGWLGGLVAGGFALFHGAAHGAEMAGMSHPAAMLTGMVAGTAVLHLTGVALGRQLSTRAAWTTRLLGGGIGLYGAALLAGLA